jgi:hypothetical protein
VQRVLSGAKGTYQAAEKRSLKEKGKRKKAENLRVFLLPSSFFLDSVNFSASSYGAKGAYRREGCL